MTIFGECDCCLKMAFLARRNATGIETYACAECCGCEPGEFDPDEDGDEEGGHA